MKPGDEVCFTFDVVRRTGSKRVGDARGVVLEVHGRVASVDFRGTYDRWPQDGGGSVRAVPVGNLSVIRDGRLPLSAVEVIK